MEKTDEFFAEEAQNHIQMIREYGKGFLDIETIDTEFAPWKIVTGIMKVF